ncbi:uncharacterized protein LOC111320118 [Stylophora pistillata]|uniref:uncharacterized protein LOC111320118 n=1 Tax=Stylophora pistillata TaxID=50429 RepID=UPI000C03A760|nr:uncharacterized protein LOC111320118 [Stylophora pistillata]
MINLFAVRQAQQPADKEHRFGYGKAEAVAALGQSVFVAGSAVWLLWEVTNRFLAPQPVQESGIGVWVMILSVVLTALLITFQNHVVKKTRSTAIKADSIHYRSDLLINLGVLGALIAYQYTGLLWVDPLVGGTIAFYILWTAVQIVRETLSVLMDRELGDEIRHKIKDIVLTHPQAKGLHDLRTRNGGTHIFIQLHLELDGDLTLRKSHDIADEVTKSLIKAFPMADILIHKDPEGIEEKRDPFPI